MYPDHSASTLIRTPGEPSEPAKARELHAQESRNPRKRRPDRLRAAVEAVPSPIDPRSTAHLYLA